ncbi:MAG: HD-GYP domain-containing protein [Lachnospiraceae bacterium]|nr:HD-GYP domain-containing protein [Lachnospiraceae bacterium]
MFEFLRIHQLNLMLILGGVCGAVALFVSISSTMSKKKKLGLMIIELATMILMFMDRASYAYRGDMSDMGFVMVRIGNFFVFSMVLVATLGFNIYLNEIYKEAYPEKGAPRILKISQGLLYVGLLLVVISQFTGLYYTIDENNLYQRSPGFIVSMLIPLVAIGLQLSVVLKLRTKISKILWIPLLLFTSAPVLATFVQLFLYGLSLNNITVVAMAILLYVFSLVDIDRRLKEAHRQQLAHMQERQESMSRLFSRTATALAKAIDDNKNHIKGHSERVAQYAREIARLSGKDEEECEKIYFAALLHDVGMMAVPDVILEKEDELTDEERVIYRNHTVAGAEILSKIEEYPYLAEGAHYHHELYDGTGYPEGLKGEEIPEAARIIAIADEYDEMTTPTSYKNYMPQTRVREVFIREAGGRYDPEFSKAIVAMIGADSEYRLRAGGNEPENIWKDTITCDRYRSDISNGIAVAGNETKVTFTYTKTQGENIRFSGPALVLYDSLDGRVHTEVEDISENAYMEYGEVWFDGHTICTRARNLVANVSAEAVNENDGESITYQLSFGRYEDHVSITIRGGGRRVTAVCALPDSIRFAYVGITGENCTITDIKVDETDRAIEADEIGRIAEEISYVNRLESDLKNTQINGYRSGYTDSVQITDGMRLEFHGMSLPTAHLVWHCPYVLVFTSKDGTVGGEGYREFTLMRLDGEVEGSDEDCENRMVVTKGDDFVGWDAWKDLNKAGMECKVSFSVRGGKVGMMTENAGISIKNTALIKKGADAPVYVALTGDQCALTDIRVY